MTQRATRETVVSSSIGREPFRAAALLPARPALRVLLCVVVALFLLVCFQQLSQPYVIDEAEFPYIADATARTGVPVYYHGELRPHDVGIFHPPLYVYTLAGWLQVFGSSHAAVRGFGVACALATAATGAATARLLVRRHRDVVTVAFVGLYLLNPLVVASALLPDIDGTLGVLSTTCGLYVLARIVVARHEDRRDVLLAGLVLGFAFSTKLTTPLALVPLLAVALVVSGRRPSLALRDFATAVAIGSALFLGWWGPLTLATHLDFTFPFSFTYDSLLSKSGHAGIVDRLRAIRPVRTTLFWLNPLLLLISLLTGIAALRRAAGSRSARALALIVVFGLGTVAMYDVITTPVFRFPKYWIAAVPALCIAAVVGTAQLLEASGQMQWRHRAAPAAAALSILLGSSLGFVLFNRAAAGRADRQPLLTSGPGVLCALVAILLVVLLLRTTGGVATRLVVPVVIGLSSLVFVQGLAQALAQRSADYSTRYYYGERGLEQAITDVRALTPRGEAILAPKDIGFQTERPFFEDSQLFFDIPRLEALLQARTTPVVVTRKDYDYSEPIYPAAFALIRQYAVPVIDRPGSGFVIWRLRAEVETRSVR